MYLISKVLPLVFSPLGAILFLLTVAIKRKKFFFVKLSIIFLFIFSNGIFSGFLWKYLEHPWKRLEFYSMDLADGIVVLSTGRKSPLGETQIIEWNDPDRFLAGIELYKAKKAKKLIFTGGVIPYEPNLPPEGDIYIKEAILLGVPSHSLSTTNSVLNTLQEAKEIKKILFKGGDNRNTIILVTSAYHMKRAKRVFEREGISVQPYPVDFKSNKSYKLLLKNPLNWIPSAKSFSATSIAIREIIGRIFYRSM